MTTAILNKALSKFTTADLQREIVARYQSEIDERQRLIALFEPKGLENGGVAGLLNGAAPESPVDQKALSSKTTRKKGKRGKATAAKAAPAKAKTKATAKTSPTAKTRAAVKAAPAKAKKPSATKKRSGKKTEIYMLEALANGEHLAPKDLLAAIKKNGWTTGSTNAGSMIGTYLDKLLKKDKKVAKDNQGLYYAV